MGSYSVPEDTTGVNEINREIGKIVHRIGVVLNKHMKMDVMYRFEMGDLMVSLLTYDRASVKGAIEGTFGQGIYKMLRTCGWIAYRWRNQARREEEMSRGRPWSYFRDTDPDAGTVYEKKGRGSSFFLGASLRHEEEDAYYVVGLGSGEKEVTVRFPEVEMEAYLESMGWTKK